MFGSKVYQIRVTKEYDIVFRFTHSPLSILAPLPRFKVDAYKSLRLN